MPRKQYHVSNEMHEASAKLCFNQTWELLEKTDRSADENDLMLHRAHCSMHHWLHIGQPKHYARGNWLLSRVYAVVGQGDLAIHFGRKCATMCDDHDLSPFDRAYAHEALARGFATAGQSDQAQHHLERAKSLAPSIDDEQERQWLLDDLATISVSGAPA